MAADDLRSNVKALAAIGIALGETGRTVNSWSRLLSGIGLLACALPPPAGTIWAVTLIAALAAGFGQLYFALRLSFDRPVFAAWEDRQCADGDAATDLAAFDNALAETGLRRANQAPRALAERVQGARRLLQKQTILFVVQATATTTGALLLLTR
jgi:hypothetical protein